LKISIQERENQAFEKVVERYGLYGTELKLQKMESCRNYYRRWPYDAWSKRVPEEHIDIVDLNSPLERMIADESREELLAGLTERELWVAQRSEEGYKPRDMAELRGKTTSNADRWIKHSVKQKMAAKIVLQSEHEPNNQLESDMF
jgi:hypothetical protein